MKILTRIKNWLKKKEEDINAPLDQAQMHRVNWLTREVERSLINQNNDNLRALANRQLPPHTPPNPPPSNPNLPMNSLDTLTLPLDGARINLNNDISVNSVRVASESGNVSTGARNANSEVNRNSNEYNRGMNDAANDLRAMYGLGHLDRSLRSIQEEAMRSMRSMSIPSAFSMGSVGTSSSWGSFTTRSTYMGEKIYTESEYKELERAKDRVIREKELECEALRVKIVNLEREMERVVRDRFSDSIGGLEV